MANTEEPGHVTEDRQSEAPALSVEDNTLKGGRNRICKQCKFTCKDSREFSQHQLSAHNESEDTHSIQDDTVSTNKDSNNNCNNSNNNNNNCSSSSSSSSNSNNSSIGSSGGNNNNNNSYYYYNNSGGGTLNNSTTTTTTNSNINNTSNTYRRNGQAKSCSPQIGNCKPDITVNGNNTVTCNNNNNNSNNCNQNNSKMHREEEDENSEPMYRDAEDDELDDRLVIAEDQDDSFSHTPIRSGNIQNRTYICPFCDFSSTSAKVFLHHQKDIHGKDFTIYECDVCDYATKYKQKLPRHRKLHFPGVEFNSSCGGSLVGPIGMTGDNTQDTSDLIMTTTTTTTTAMTMGPSDMDIRKRDEEMDDELDDEDMEIVMEDGSGMDDSQRQKTKRTRQEVDPAKYIEVMDEVGIKYSCSKCGNIYKWRKSLNKHWKEKHADEKLDCIKQTLTPLNHMKLGSTKINPEMIRRESCEKLMYKKEGQPNGYTIGEDGRVCHEKMGVSDIVMPKMIGPFVTNSYLSAYSNENGPPSGRGNTNLGVLDLSRKTPNSMSSNAQREPIDFSVKREPNPIPNLPGGMTIKAEPIWDQEQQAVEGSDDQKQDSNILQCSKCSFVAKTFIDYSSHMAVHLNKRAFKCAECHLHFSCVEDLNLHFGKFHLNKIYEHRDVIQKIPHGLQQTYHLLRMPLSSKEFNSADQRQLKCSRCEFVAKWPAELQKHAVSHSEERPFICMVCASTYKWKWDLVKHFEKSHSTLINPYKRRSTILGSNISEPTISRTADALVDGQTLDLAMIPKKKRRLSETDLTAIHPRYLDTDTSDSLRFERSLHSNRSSPLFFRERSSSVPPYLSNFPERIRYNEKESEENDSPGLQITNVYSLVKDKTHSSQPDSMDNSSMYPIYNQSSGERLMYFPEHFSNFEDHHKAVNAALRQRINMSSNRNKRQSSTGSNEKDKSCADILLPYKCTLCQYRARWPSEITQHMKNHSDEKPFCCPECSYKSKWKWDVVKHMKRCGGGTVKDVIDNSKMKSGPPNVVVTMREEPMDTDKVPKPPGSILTNGDSNQFSFMPILPAGKVPTASNEMARKTPLELDQQQKLPSSGLDLRKDSGSKPNPYYRDLVNNGLYHCLECQFVGHSPAELKRHAYLHSEDKPYVCEVCTYSSRWKCDLKKHIRTYNHYGSSANGSGGDNSQKSLSPDTFRELSAPGEPKVYKCDHCSFESDSRPALEVHAKSHEKEAVMHRCFKCNFIAEDSLSLNQHMLSHDDHTPPSAPTVPSSANSDKVSSRTRHLKNCRRPIKQYQCGKCPYVCSNEMELVMHKEGHNPLGSSAFRCFFCDFNSLQKLPLINHLYLHPEFETSDKAKFEEILNFSQLTDIWHTAKDLQDMDYADAMDYYSSSETYDLVKDKKPDSTVYKRDDMEIEEKENRFINGMSPMRDMSLKRLQCEWCEAAFAHISTLYQHARSVHPILLQQQEYENNIKYDDLPPPPPPPPLPNYNGVAVSQNSAFNSVLPKNIQTPRKVLPNQLAKPQKNPSPGKTGGPFKCQKCPFIGASSNTYSRHMERHGSNCKHTCLYCDYSIDRLNLLHQHMRGSHGHDVKQSPINNSAIDKSSPNGSHKHELSNRVILSTPSYFQKSDGTTESHLRPIAPKPVEGTHSEISQSLPILEHGANGKYMYRCPNCSFCSSKVANTSAHIRTHYMSQNYMDSKKYGENKLSSEFNYTSYLSDTTNKKFNNKFENPMSARPANCDCNDMSNPHQLTKPPHQQTKLLSNTPMLLCLQCPFKTTTKESLHEHQEFHGYKGQYRCSECNFSVDHVNIFCDHSALHTANSSNQNPNNNCNNSSNNNDNNNNIMMNNNNNNSINNNNNNNSDMNRMNTSRINYRSSNEGPEGKSNPPKMGGGGGGGVSSGLGRSGADRPYHSKYDSNSSERRGKLNLQQMLKQVKMAGRVRYKCSRCPYRTCCKNNIIKHRKQHIVNSRYKCQYCNYSAARKYLLQQHLKFHRDESSEQGKEFQDVVLDPYDENSVKTLKESSDYNKDLMSPKSYDNPSKRKKIYSGESSSVPTMSVMVTANSTAETDDHLDMLEEDEEKHYSNDHNPDRRPNYLCSLCPFKCNTAVVFQRHSQFHNAKLKYKCGSCNYSVDRFNLLTRHSLLHSEQTSFSPSVSPEDMSAMDYKSSPLHMSPSSSSPPSSSSYNAFMNQTCLKDSTDDRNMSLSSMDEQILNSEKFHMQMGPEGSDEDLRYHCKVCPYMSNSLKSYNVHSSMHGCQGKYKCDYCDWSTNRLNLLNQHRKVHSREPNFDPSPDELTFLNREALLHSDEIPTTTTDAEDCNQVNSSDPQPPLSPQSRKCYSCKSCPYSCINKSSFLLHVGLHRNPAHYKCSQCSYSVSQWNMLQQHERTHSFGSDGCNSVDANGLAMNPTASPGTVKARLHCPKCPYHCHAQHLLDTHMKMHETGERCVCSFCDFSTENWQLFQKHMEIHNGMTNLRNLPSPDSNLDSTNLLEQQSKLGVSGEGCDNIEDSVGSKYSEMQCAADYRCSQCPFTTPSYDSLQQHMSSQHDMERRIGTTHHFNQSYNEKQQQQQQQHHHHQPQHHEHQHHHQQEQQQQQQHSPSTTTTTTEEKPEESGMELDCPVTETDKSNDDDDNNTNNNNTNTNNSNQGNSSNCVNEPEGKQLNKTETGECTTTSSPVVDEDNLLDEDCSTKSKLGSASFECQYCDRGYDDEMSMQEHERHHYKAYESIQQ